MARWVKFRLDRFYSKHSSFHSMSTAADPLQSCTTFPAENLDPTLWTGPRRMVKWKNLRTTDFSFCMLSLCLTFTIQWVGNPFFSTGGVNWIITNLMNVSWRIRHSMTYSYCTVPSQECCTPPSPLLFRCAGYFCHCFPTCCCLKRLPCYLVGESGAFGAGGTRDHAPQ
jgi:hypothetical protein